MASLTEVICIGLIIIFGVAAEPFIHPELAPRNTGVVIRVPAILLNVCPANQPKPWGR